MEAQNCIACLKCGHQPTKVTIWDTHKLSRLNPAEKEDMRNVIDEMGRLSAFAQRLKVPITDYDRIKFGNQTLYLLTSNGPTKDVILVKGLLKVGIKNLFIRKECGALVEINPLCVLDFYVHFSCQRIGLGRQIFDAMLAHMKKMAHQIGYDRPSQKLLSFLAKHYNLKRFYPQANQFVIYNAYFDSTCKDDMRIQSRLCDCIKDGNRKTCTVALLDSPRTDKEILHGRRANTSPNPKPPQEIVSEEKRPITPAIIRRRSLLQDDEVRAVPSARQIFPEYTNPVEYHYDWMTGKKKTLPGIFLNGVEESDRGKLKSSSNNKRFVPPDTMVSSKSPRASHRAQLSGFGAAAALGFNQR